MTLHEALTQSILIEAVKPRPIVTQPKRVNGWWIVEMNNDRNMGFETEALAKKFIRENRT